MSSRGSFGSYDTGTNYSTYQTGGAGRDTSNDFIRLSQSVGNNIQKINQNVSQMQRYINQIGTTQDNPELRDKLHQLQHYTNQLAKDTNKYMKDLAHLPCTQSEQRQRKLQNDRLRDEFMDALNRFQDAQRKAASKEKESVARARAHSGSTYDPFSDEKKRDDPLVRIDGPPGQQQQPQHQQQSILMEEDVDLQLLREREQAIHKLESDIMDVNTIFKDLGMLVHEQGEVIDSIEANVENAQVHVEQGTQQLAKAKDYQSKARKKKCIIILIILIVLAIIATILGVVLSK